MKINRLLNYICKKYEETDLEMDAIAGNKNIKRHTRLTMSSYVENSIAILIEDILSKQGKKYNYLVDVQLNVDGHIKRPDILIYDDDNVIHGVVEIKSQLGWEGDFNKDGRYFKRIKSIKTGKIITANNREISDEIFDLKNEIRKLENKKVKNYEIINKKDRKKELEKQEKTNYTIAEDFKDFIVIFMDTNGHGNLKNFVNTNYFVLFHDDVETVWYNNLNEKFLTNKNTNSEYVKDHTYDDLVEFLEKNF